MPGTSANKGRKETQERGQPQPHRSRKGIVASPKENQKPNPSSTTTKQTLEGERRDSHQGCARTHTHRHTQTLLRPAEPGQQPRVEAEQGAARLPSACGRERAARAARVRVPARLVPTPSLPSRRQLLANCSAPFMHTSPLIFHFSFCR